MSFKATEEQKKIFHFIKNRKENLLIGALAGAGKTTTVVRGAELLPKDSKKIYLAFNKHIQMELKEKLPEDVFCYTFHGLGTNAIKNTYGDSIKFDEFKVDNIIKKKSKRWGLEKELLDSGDRMDYLNKVKKFVNLCRQTVTLDKKYLPHLSTKYDIELDEPRDHKRVWSVLEEMVNDRRTFDFTDMVFLPAIDNKIWTYQYDYVIVDEVQDLNRAQQYLLKKILKKDRITKKTTGRLIAVGDVHQSIYGFTGVSDKSWDWFVKFPNTKMLPLTVTFRCGKEIVKEAQKIVPAIQALPNAIEGIVREGSVLDEPESGDFVLCRTTTPLIKLFFHYLLQGKKAMIKGSDIGVSLNEMIQGHKTLAQLMAHYQNKLKEYQTALRKRGILNYNDDNGYITLSDNVMALEFMSKLSNDISDLKMKVNTIFSDEMYGIVLSTVHKAKGLEADRVFIARPDKMPLPTKKAWQHLQELNLKYVAITRAKNELIFDHEWVDDDQEGEIT
jgi:DNA helicase-2/ATP-dependent DNA helicase PcrA